jgi:hypothetical protein
MIRSTPNPVAAQVSMHHFYTSQWLTNILRRGDVLGQLDRNPASANIQKTFSLLGTFHYFQLVSKCASHCKTAQVVKVQER